MLMVFTSLSHWTLGDPKRVRSLLQEGKRLDYKCVNVTIQLWLGELVKEQ